MQRDPFHRVDVHDSSREVVVRVGGRVVAQTTRAKLLFETGLPVYWCPCFGKDGYETLYEADQPTVVGACRPAVRNFFVYCLTRSEEDPIAFLRTGPHPLPTGPRWMWCTAPMFHAAGRRVYERGPSDFVGLQPAEAGRSGLAGKEVAAFTFEPMRAVLEPPSPDSAAVEPKPGQALYAGRTDDRVGTALPEPDGRADCRARLGGVDAAKPIENVVLTGPKEARWEFVETPRWWRLAQRRDGAKLDVWFQFWAAGEHRVEVRYADGTKQSATFEVPDVAASGMAVELRPAEPNGFVFRNADPRYPTIMESCLKNLLSGLGDAP